MRTIYNLDAGVKRSLHGVLSERGDLDADIKAGSVASMATGYMRDRIEHLIFNESEVRGLTEKREAAKKAGKRLPDVLVDRLILQQAFSDLKDWAKQNISR